MEVMGGMGFYAFFSYAGGTMASLSGLSLKSAMGLAFVLRFLFQMCALSRRDVGFEGAKLLGISLLISTLKKLYFINTMRV